MNSTRRQFLLQAAGGLLLATATARANTRTRYLSTTSTALFLAPGYTGSIALDARAQGLLTSELTIMPQGNVQQVNNLPMFGLKDTDSFTITPRAIDRNGKVVNGEPVSFSFQTSDTKRVVVKIPAGWSGAGGDLLRGVVRSTCDFARGSLLLAFSES